MKILLNAKIDPEHIAKIQAGFPAVQVDQADDPEKAKALMPGVEVLVTWWQNFRPDLPDYPALKWIHSLSAGVEDFTQPQVTEGKILLTNSRGIHGIPISEHVLAMMLSFSRGLHQFVKNQAQSKWQRVPLSELRGKTMGLVGLGSIGREIARLGAAFGMRVLAVKRSPGPPSEEVNRVVTLEGMEMVLRESDYLVIAIPLTAETRGLIGPKQLAVMKPTAILINIARGDVLDEGALITALEQGRIAGAGLDVFETEPLPPHSPLWQMENCLITPHTAAQSPQYMSRATDLFCRNLDAYIKGEPLPTLVDPKRGY